MGETETNSVSVAWRLPPPPGTAPVPDGHVRLYHQSDIGNLRSIRRQGILLRHARDFEGPVAIYADERGFYGTPDQYPTVEFHVPQDRWDRPFVLGDVEPGDIIAVHHPWHAHARYIERNPGLISKILAGGHDLLLKDPHYGKAISFTKHRYGDLLKGGEPTADDGLPIAQP